MFPLQTKNSSLRCLNQLSCLPTVSGILHGGCADAAGLRIGDVLLLVSYTVM